MILILLIAIINPGMLQAQNGRSSIGITSSAGMQSVFPFNSGSYEYSFKSIGFFWKRQFKSNKRWSLFYEFEPAYYHATHVLINPWYKLDERDQLYASKIPLFQTSKIIREYVLKFGLDLQYEISPKWRLNMLLSIGPTYSDTETERLARGLAFSDLLGLGVVCYINNIHINIITGVRHVSNANLQRPNNGHNASFIGCRIGYQLK